VDDAELHPPHVQGRQPVNAGRRKGRSIVAADRLGQPDRSKECAQYRLRARSRDGVPKFISPPIIDYDAQSRLLQVVDSTFYFFIRNANLKEILELIPNPLTAG
jgi:hypothetical protein